MKAKITSGPILIILLRPPFVRLSSHQLSLCLYLKTSSPLSLIAINVIIEMDFVYGGKGNYWELV